MLSSSVLSVAQTLSPAEADAIIAAKEQVKLDRQQARIAELEKAEVLSEGRSILPNGQEVIVREVKPPNIEPSHAEATPVAQQFSPTPEQIAALQAQAGKRSEALMLSATVYDNEVTRISWTHDSKKFIAFTNADFNYLRTVHSIETDTHRYTFFMAIGDGTRAKNSYPNEAIPLASAFSSDHSEYILTQGNANNEAALNGIAALLNHYDANLESLIVEHQRREALTAAKKRYDAANPKEPEPFIMQFWVPETTDGNAAQ